MAFEEDLATLLVSNSGYIVLGLAILFFSGLACLFAYAWWKDMLPFSHKYNMGYTLRERKGKYLMPVAHGRARIYKDKDGKTFYALKTGFFSEIKQVPPPAIVNIYPNDTIDVIREGRDNYRTMIFTEDKTDEDLEKYRITMENEERWKDGYAKAERARLERTDQPNWIWNLLPYMCLMVTIVGCFLIISVLQAPLTILIQGNADAMSDYRAASEANLKIAQLMNAGKNGTVPLTNVSEAPPG
jgi:hypothetical protein